MTAAWYAIVDHVGDIRDLIGQEVVIVAVRRLPEWPLTVAEEMPKTASGRAWCRVFPTGEQVPTRGGVMRVVAWHKALGNVGADMLSADEMLVRVNAELETRTDALREMTSDRDRWQAEAMRWRERAAPQVDCEGCGDPIADGDRVEVGPVNVHRACYASLGHDEVASLASECPGREP